MMRPIYVSLAAILALSGCADTNAPEVDAGAVVDAVETAATEMTESGQEMLAQTETEMAEPQAETMVTTEVRSLDAHVHGNANLALVLENGRVTAELETPLFNVLGFEHLPETEAQRTAVADAEATLSDPSALMAFNSAAGCSPVALAEPVALFAAGGDDGHDGHDHGDHHDEHDHDSHDHDDHDHHDDAHAHDEDKHDHAETKEASHDHGDYRAHSDDHDHSDHDHGAHREARVTYTFACDTADALDSVTLTLFEAFPLLEALDVVYLGPDTQASFELSPANNRIALRP